ncbi:LytR/AlgR family response regulator transcription factor [Maribacter ulvicola]|uniref:Two component transcriptional regulator, LytTR family n=1 Tax=Maribacter ulvicola TaxID=228959 RepID=A0A1N6ZB55_9FLAO|nr:LytTR family DNA-binding domain-containing protein [Maribacter ulvicola]SIR24027.1 two component transcriptional regulator, LytTR family [Maribacter ulvicola]
MKTFKCAIIEDSNTQRKLLEQIIDKNKSLKLLHSSSATTESLAHVNNLKIDFLFLDIEMPIMNGFEFLKGLTITPQVIITSQNQKYALDAFEFNVTDFLLKPYSTARLDAAISKAIEKLRSIKKKLPESRLLVKHNLKQIELNVHGILYVEALGDYVKVVTEDRNYVILSTMNGFNNRLEAKKFIRIHKSYIINLKMVERYNHEFIEIKNKKIPISRAKIVELDRLLNCFE